MRNEIQIWMLRRCLDSIGMQRVQLTLMRGTITRSRYPKVRARKSLMYLDYKDYLESLIDIY